MITCSHELPFANRNGLLKSLPQRGSDFHFHVALKTSRIPLDRLKALGSSRKPGLNLKREIIQSVFIHGQSFIQKVLGRLEEEQVQGQISDGGVFFLLNKLMLIIWEGKTSTLTWSSILYGVCWNWRISLMMWEILSKSRINSYYSEHDISVRIPTCSSSVISNHCAAVH